MRAPPPAVAAALAAALLAAPPARADSVTDQIDAAKRYYGEGDVAGAIGELEFALQELRGKVAAAYLATFPAPAAGWTAADAASATPDGSSAAAGAGGGEAAAMPAFLGGGNVLQREYRAAAGEGSIDAQLMTGGSFLQGLASMFMNPQLMAAQPGAKRVRVGRDNAVLTFDPADRTGQLVLDVSGKVTIMLQGSGLDSGDPLVELANRWDLKRVREIAGL